MSKENTNLVRLNDFALTKAELDATGQTIIDVAIEENRAAETLFKLKVMEDLIDQVKKGVYEKAVTEIREQLKAKTGTVTVGKADINIQVPHSTNVTAKFIDEANEKIAQLKAEIKAVTEIAKSINKPLKHPTYGTIHPATQEEQNPKFVVKLHRI